jgi:RNA polymerase sigma-B factor
MRGGEETPLEQLDDLMLIRVIQSEDHGSPRREAAQAELVARYRSVVVSCAARYRHSPESQDDLIQVGFVGLLNAINNFDPEAGSSLLAYARPCISGEIKRHFRDKRWQFHVRRSAQELRARLRAAQSDLAQQLFRVPTQREIAEHLGISAAELADA